MRVDFGDKKEQGWTVEGEEKNPALFIS